MPTLAAHQLYCGVVWSPCSTYIVNIPLSRYHWGGLKSFLYYYVFGLWCLTPLSTVFQLYCGGQFH